MGNRINIKKYKFLHWIYNLLHYKSLSHNKAAYKKYAIHRSVIASISSKDFPDKESRAWLDRGDSGKLAPLKEGFAHFPAAIQQQLVSWSANGYIILEHFFDAAATGSILEGIVPLVMERKPHPTPVNKLMCCNRLSPLAR